MPDRWPQVERLDVTELIRRVHAAGGPRLVVSQSLAGGQVGAAVVALPSGAEVVLSAWPPGMGRAEQIAALISVLRARGYPAPEILQLIDCGSRVAVLQQRLNGRAPKHVDQALLLDLLEVHAGQHDVLAEPGGSADELYLERDGPGFCLHRPLAEYSPATAALLGRITEIARSTPADVGRGSDIVHGDFQPTNVLVGGPGARQVAGVVDWTGARPGDAGLDLVTLGFFLDRAAAPAGCRALLRERIAARVRPHAGLAFAAHMALRQVDWVIRHDDTAEVDAWLAVANDWLDWAGSAAQRVIRPAGLG